MRTRKSQSQASAIFFIFTDKQLAFGGVLNAKLLMCIQQLIGFK